MASSTSSCAPSAAAPSRPSSPSSCTPGSQGSVRRAPAPASESAWGAPCDPAVADIRAAIRLNPRNALYYRLSSKIAEALGDKDQAILDAERDLQLAPKTPANEAFRRKLEDIKRRRAQGGP